MTHGSQEKGFRADSIPLHLLKLLESSFKHKIHRLPCLKQRISLCASGDAAETGNLHNTEKIKHGEIKGLPSSGHLC